MAIPVWLAKVGKVVGAAVAVGGVGYGGYRLAEHEGWIGGSPPGPIATPPLPPGAARPEPKVVPLTITHKKHPRPPGARYTTLEGGGHYRVVWLVQADGITSRRVRMDVVVPKRAPHRPPARAAHLPPRPHAPPLPAGPSPGSDAAAPPAAAPSPGTARHTAPPADGTPPAGSPGFSSDASPLDPGKLLGPAVAGASAAAPLAAPLAQAGAQAAQAFGGGLPGFPGAGAPRGRAPASPPTPSLPVDPGALAGAARAAAGSLGGVLGSGSNGAPGGGSKPPAAWTPPKPAGGSTNPEDAPDDPSWTGPLIRGASPFGRASGEGDV